ncbi:MAG: L-fucose/L-arabinose isomerase family protein, partial [Beijerinckiaceae bacterium]
MKQPLKIAVLPLARPTFDVPFAEEMARRAFAALDATGNSIIGPRTLLFDAAQTQGAIDAVTSETIDLVLILQVTFTDATMTVKIAEQLKAPLAIWAFPEPRTG